MSSSDFEIIITWKISYSSFGVPFRSLPPRILHNAALVSRRANHYSDVSDPRVEYPIKDNNYGIQIVGYTRNEKD
jgi:hypothetical protein